MIADIDEIRILLVADDDGEARRIQAMLARGRLDFAPVVTRVASAGEALQWLGRHSIHIVLIDASRQPSWSLAAFDAIRQAAPDAVLFVQAGSADPEMVQQYRERGAHGVFCPVSVSSGELHRFLCSSVFWQRVRMGLPPGPERWLAVLRHSPWGVCVTDPAGRMQWVNDAFCRLAGNEESFLLGEYADALLHPADREQYRQAMRRLLAGEAVTVQTRERRLRHDGGLRWCRTSSAALRGMNGNVLGVIHSVDDRTSTRSRQRQLHKERQLLDQLMNMMPDAIFFKDRQGRFTRVNPAAVAKLGCRLPSEVIGRRDDDFFAPEQVEEGRMEEDAILATGEPSLCTDVKEVWKDGHITWVSRSKLPLRNARGEVTGIFGFVHDLTARHRAEEALRASESQYRSLFEYLPSPMWIQDVASGRILAVNRMAIAHYGYSRDEFLSMSARDLLVSENGEPADRSSSGMFPGSGTPLHCRHRRRDGAVIDVEVAMRAILFDGRPAEYALINDVTERSRGESALRESEERYRAVVEQVAEAILLVDPESLAILSANQAAQELFGYSKEEFLAMTIVELSAGNEQEKRASLRQVREQGRKRLGNGCYVRRDGTLRLVERDGSVIQFGGREVICIVVRDIQGRVELENQLRQAQKLEAVGRLAGGVAHDFNNLLTVVTGSCDELLHRADLAPDTMDGLRQIASAADRAAGLTRQLLAFSRKQVLQPRMIDLDERIGSIATLLRRLIGEDVTLTTRSSGYPARIEADPNQVEQVLLNLGVNARDAMPAGGHLSIETRPVRIDAPVLLSHDQILPGDYILMEVCDTGCGMTPEVMAQIFEPFFSTKGEQGSGLGLSTVYGIVRQSGGYVSVASEPGRGSRFQIYFPTASGEVASPEPPSPEPPSLDAAQIQGNAVILLVEDQEEIRAVTRHLLEARGFQVIDVASPDEALEICRRWERPIDLLLTDIVMPGMSGLQLARMVTGLRPAVRCLFMSGYSEEAVTGNVHPVPRSAFIQKPFQGRQLAARVQEVLRS